MKKCTYCDEKATHRIWDENLGQYILVCDDCYEEITLEERILSETEEF